MARHHPHLSNSTDPTLAAKSRSTWEIVLRVSKYLKPYKLTALGTIGFTILSLASSFAFPQLTQYVVDEVIAKQRPEKLLYVIAGILGAFFLRDLFNSVRIRINN